MRMSKELTHNEKKGRTITEKDLIDNVVERGVFTDHSVMIITNTKRNLLLVVIDDETVVDFRNIGEITLHCLSDKEYEDLEAGRDFVGSEGFPL